MGFSLKKWLYKNKLKQKLSSLSTAKAPSNNLGKTVGLIYTDADDKATIDKLKKDLRTFGRQSFELIYIHSKEVIDPEVQLNTFSLKNLNWFNWPNSPAIEVFQKRHYDILLVLTSKDLPAIHHVVQTTSAFLKIGNTSYSDHLNLIIDGDENMSTKHLVKQILDTLVDLQPTKK